MHYFELISIFCTQISFGNIYFERFPTEFSLLIKFSLTFYQAMESCPKADIENLKDLLKEENLYLFTEVSKVSWHSDSDWIGLDWIDSRIFLFLNSIYRTYVSQLRTYMSSVLNDLLLKLFLGASKVASMQNPYGSWNANFYLYGAWEALDFAASHL